MAKLINQSRTRYHHSVNRLVMSASVIAWYCRTCSRASERESSGVRQTSINRMRSLSNPNMNQGCVDNGQLSREREREIERIAEILSYGIRKYPVVFDRFFCQKYLVENICIFRALKMKAQFCCDSLRWIPDESTRRLLRNLHLLFDESKCISEVDSSRDKSSLTSVYSSSFPSAYFAFL